MYVVKKIVLFRIMFIEKLKFHSENDIHSLFIKQPHIKGYHIFGPYLDSPRIEAGIIYDFGISLKRLNKFYSVYIFSPKK